MKQHRRKVKELRGKKHRIDKNIWTKDRKITGNVRMEEKEKTRITRTKENHTKKNEKKSKENKQ